ncbi:MAG: DUF3267 domain-containing protein [Erysipelotrichaceae bacterium]|nr:DUF3267 domain-containing protein [Erysipelotrichaceae bacterium]
MGNTKELDERYKEIQTIDFQKDQKYNTAVNILSIVLAIITYVIGNAIVPISTLLTSDNNEYFSRLWMIVVGLALYIILMQILRSSCIYSNSHESAKMGFRGLSGYAGSEYYFNKVTYLYIRLLPFITAFIVLIILCMRFDTALFWVPYFVMLYHIASSGSDFYIIYILSKLPQDVMVQDIGTSMKIYGKK